MYISKIVIQNFRLLKDSRLTLEDEANKDLSLLIGRNNCGKTSFIVLFEKFLSSHNFGFDDISIELRKDILEINDDTNEHKLAIRLLLTIEYTDDDSLENLSDFIVDLDPNCNKVQIAFEVSLKKKQLLKDLKGIKDRIPEYIQKNLSQYIEINLFIYNSESDFEIDNRSNLVKKENNLINDLINFQVIHANRNIASSESGSQGKRVLSGLTTQFYNSKNKVTHDDLNEINASIIEMDSALNANYKTFFASFLENAKNFLDMKDLNVVSDLQSKEILANHSKIIYGEKGSSLPEYLNGLGSMNILYLLLQIEIKKRHFLGNMLDINLLFIEEPEAHTHPQMQYVFIDKITETLQNITGLQTFISTHSAHIVKKCDFKDIRYFLKKDNPDNVEIRNFYKELKEKYIAEDPNEDRIEKKHFKFLNQYLSIGSSELFFAEKIIFIEGITEKILLPYFIDIFDQKNGDKKDLPKLTSQNISILEVGANAKAFRHFLDFLEIRTLIITDLDTTIKKIPEKEKGKTTYPACGVLEGTHTSNYTLKHYLKAPKIDSPEFPEWMEKLKQHEHSDPSSIIKLTYQNEENGYHGRSFEEAFFNANLELIEKNIKEIEGLKNKDHFTENKGNVDKLVSLILKKDGKSDFASSILYLALSDDDLEWNIPAYVKEGLMWIVK